MARWLFIHGHHKYAHVRTHYTKKDTIECVSLWDGKGEDREFATWVEDCDELFKNLHI